MAGKIKTDVLPPKDASKSPSSTADTEVSDSFQAADALRRRLDEGRFPGGRLPPERRLAEDLGIGRRALRRALCLLEQEGRIWRRQGLGTFVGVAPVPTEPELLRPFDLARLASPLTLMETRLIIEPTTARLAAMRATQAQIDQLKHTVEQTFEARSAQEYEDRDSRFHRTIADVAGNVLLAATLDLLSGVRREARWGQMRTVSFSTERLKLLGGEHMAILDAIVDRDPGRAENEMRRHLRGVAIRLVGIDPLPTLVPAEEESP